MIKVHGVGKLQKKVSFNIASEASYVYILSEQKFIKNAKKMDENANFEKLKNETFLVIFKHCGSSVLKEKNTDTTRLLLLWG